MENEGPRADLEGKSAFLLPSGTGRGSPLHRQTHWVPKTCAFDRFCSRGRGVDEPSLGSAAPALYLRRSREARRAGFAFVHLPNGLFASALTPQDGLDLPAASRALRASDATRLRVTTLGRTRPPFAGASFAGDRVEVSPPTPTSNCWDSGGFPPPPATRAPMVAGSVATTQVVCDVSIRPNRRRTITKGSRVPKVVRDPCR